MQKASFEEKKGCDSRILTPGQVTFHVWKLWKNSHICKNLDEYFYAHLKNKYVKMFLSE